LFKATETQRHRDFYLERLTKPQGCHSEEPFDVAQDKLRDEESEILQGDYPEMNKEFQA
jgi:hypothetical protein